ncbi:MAG: hypothetical protein IJM44_04515 [Ruminococcus sp.]|nr:hypothetical protein [Ruminococcus sp.]
MKLKRILALLLACTMTGCAFASCSLTKDVEEKVEAGSDENEDSDNEEEEETSKRSRKSQKDEEEDATEDSSPETSADPGSSDEDLDDVAEKIAQAFEYSCVDLNNGEGTYVRNAVATSVGPCFYGNKDDSSVDFELLHDYAKDYFPELDDYEYLVYLNWDYPLQTYVAKNIDDNVLGKAGYTLDEYEGYTLPMLYNEYYNSIDLEVWYAGSSQDDDELNRLGEIAETVYGYVENALDEAESQGFYTQSAISAGGELISPGCLLLTRREKSGYETGRPPLFNEALRDQIGYDFDYSFFAYINANSVVSVYVADKPTDSTVVMYNGSTAEEYIYGDLDETYSEFVTSACT